MGDVLQSVGSFLEGRLFSISGTDVTVGSLLVCVAIIIGGLLTARLLGRATRIAIVRRGKAEGAAFAMAKIVRYTINFIALFIAVETLGVDLTALAAGAGVLLVGIGFGLQTIAQNFVSGLIVLLERPVKTGDFIRVSDTYGRVKNIGMRATQVVTLDEVTILIPNSELISAQVTNHSVPTEQVRTRVTVGVAYGSDVPLVRETLLACAHAHENVLKSPEPAVFFAEFGDSSLNFTLYFWHASPGLAPKIASDLRFAIDDAFRQAGIAIPFPQRDLHVRSGLGVLAGGARDAG